MTTSLPQVTWRPLLDRDGNPIYAEPRSGYWQPIETAPQGQRILAYNKMTGVYVTVGADGEWPMRGWDPMDGMWFPRPTHWTPMPDPPEEIDG